MLRMLLWMAGASLAFAQQYTISTVAGGAPPSTPAAAANTSIGQTRRVTVDSAGNVYFSSANSVFKLNGSGTLTLVAGNSRAGYSGDGGPAINAQLNVPQGLAIDPSGNLYIADSLNHRVRKVDTNGIITTFAGTGIYSTGGANTFNDGGPANQGLLRLPMGVTSDKSGNIYIADTGDNLVRIVTTDGTISSFAGDGYAGYLGDGGTAINAELHSPMDVAVDSSGNVYISDNANAYIRKVTTDGVINLIAGNGTIGYAGDGAAANLAELWAPVALALDSSGNLFFVENGDCRIRKIDTKGIITTVVGDGKAGFSGDGTTLANYAETNSPSGVAVDSSGNLYIADSLNLRIRKVTSSNAVSTVAGNGLLSFSGDGGRALAAQMNSPQAVAMDGAGNLYVADSGNNVVRRVSPDGTILTVAGNGAAGFGGDGGAATSAQLNSPQGLAVDTAGNLYISDTLNARVRKVSGGSISTVAGSGTAGFGGDGGAATSAQLNSPLGLAVDAAGNLYIADFSNNRVRKVSGGNITTVAGTGSSGYAGDGAAAAGAQLNTPQAVAVDAAGNLYIADTGNSVVRKVSASGTIGTIAGTGLTGYSGDGGPATSAQLINPSGLAVDSTGNVYVSDGSVNIRKIYFTGTIVTIAGTGTKGYSGDGGLATNAQLSLPAGLAVDTAGNVYVADVGNQAVRALRPSAGTLAITAVTNGASNLKGGIAPGEVVVLYGSGLGPGTLAQFTLGSNGLVPTSVAGTSVVFNGAFPAPVLYTSSNQVAALVPFSVNGSTAQVYVQYQGQPSAPVTVNVAPVAPAVFTANASGTGPALAFNLAGAVNDASHPAAADSYVSFYVTGAGQTNPPGADGKPLASGDTLPLPVVPLAVTIGGKAATVQYAGGALNLVAGVIQVNVQIPEGLAAGAAPLVVQQGGVTSQAGVTLWVSGN